MRKLGFAVAIQSYILRVFVTPVDKQRIPLTRLAGIVRISDRMPKNIKVAIAGVGNCASALVQGVEYYRSRRNAALRRRYAPGHRRLPGERCRVRFRI